MSEAPRLFDASRSKGASPEAASSGHLRQQVLERAFRANPATVRQGTTSTSRQTRGGLDQPTTKTHDRPSLKSRSRCLIVVDTSAILQRPGVRSETINRYGDLTFHPTSRTAAVAESPAIWMASRQFAGRIVTVSNSNIFAEPVFNVSVVWPPPSARSPGVR